jgi:site-specific DNA-methyltransferase (adenine-specific)
MRWLVRLVTPPGGTVLDMFAGSGTTGRAALEEGFKSIMVDISEEYLRIQEARAREVQVGLPI